MTPSRSIRVWPAETIVLTQGELDLTDTTGTTTINGLGVKPTDDQRQQRFACVRRQQWSKC